MVLEQYCLVSAVGILCVIFGLYEKLVNSILDIFKNFKKNFTFLFPIVLGIGIGFLFFSNILNSYFVTYQIEFKSLFLGLILGGIPSLFKQANKEKKFKFSLLLYTFISFCFGLFLIFLEKNLDTSFFITENNFLFLFLCGFVMSCGIIIPGISSTVILMCFGIYYTYLESICTFNLNVLLPMGLGIIIGCITFLILIRFLFKNFYSKTFYSIIGFVFGSIFIIIPNSFSLFSILLFLLGLFISLKIEK
ncbi:MAG: DUF368 domain-containing protein [Clostridiaceae bacterium]|nr:DUF368 domain-containing protein [Clostridiaceae bacterium]